MAPGRVPEAGRRPPPGHWAAGLPRLRLHPADVRAIISKTDSCVKHPKPWGVHILIGDDETMPRIVTELPGPKGREYLAKSDKYEPRSIGYQEPLVWEKASGCVITDVDGNEFLDWCSGVLVTNVGHCHPYYVEQIKAQAEKLYNCYDFLSTPRADLAQKLVEISPEYLDKAFLVTTGSDATEAAIRMVRRAHDGWEIIGFHGAFHGRTMGAASVGASRCRHSPVRKKSTYQPEYRTGR